MISFYHPFQAALTQPGLKKLGLDLKMSKPCELLRGKVFSYLQIKAERPTPYPVMPDGTQAIYISAHGSMISGAQLELRNIRLLEPGEYFGIWFYPGALRYFFDLNLNEISGQLVDNHYFECRRFLTLHNEIYRHQDFIERANRCESWLLSRYSYDFNTKFDLALQIIFQSSGNERISQVAKQVGWSSRHLNRQFIQHVGLATKSFSQLVRVQGVCKQLLLQPSATLTRSLDMGYSDQSHLIREFKQHLILTPSEFFNCFMSDLYNPK